MSRILKIILAANLIVLAVLVFVYPNLMVGPGKLIPGHKQLETNCFACHASFGGAASERCVTCHKPAEIGRLTSTGLPIAKPLTSTPFHQKLSSQDCVACHSDHAGVKRFRYKGGSIMRCCKSRRAISARIAINRLAIPCIGRSAVTAASATPRKSGLPQPLTTISSFRVRPRPRHELRNLPRTQRLQPLHLLRLPRAHSGQHTPRTY